MFMMFLTALWVVMLVAPLALLVALLPSGRDCPRCGSETLPIRVRPLKPVRRFLGRRWCTACGWEGIMRVTRHAPAPAVEVVHHEPDEVDDDAVWRGERDSGGGVI
ncbi:MAG TPA: hypothetical protein VF746_25055 [Longimicrobium sp.]|jgi:hypothetical protein